MPKTLVRYGIRTDAPFAGYPVCEAITYTEVDEHHPGAEQYPDWPGWWLVTAAADVLPPDAQVVDRAGFVVAWADWHAAQGVPVPPLPALPVATELVSIGDPW